MINHIMMKFSYSSNLFSVWFILFLYFLHATIAIDKITSSSSSSQFMKDHETLISKDGNFTFGFFTPINSTNRYVGIWWKSEFTNIWVANRNHPLKDSNGTVTISNDGNLVVLNGEKQVIWSSNVSNIASSNSTVEFSEFGNLVLLDSTSGKMLWQSIQQPSNTLLPGTELSIDKRTGEKIRLRSWKSPSDPSFGSFSTSIVERRNILEIFIWNETRTYWRSGPWNGGVFTGISSRTDEHFYGFQGGNDGGGNLNIYYTIPNGVAFVIYVLNSQGEIESTLWDDVKKEVKVTWANRESECDSYGICGIFASCSSLSSPICTCLKEFEPKTIQEWNRNNWTGGCVRKTPLQCERIDNTKDEDDVFLKLQMVKIPDFAEGVAVTPDICRSLCLHNCSCVAYAHDAGIGCMSWTRNLLDIQLLKSGGLNLYVRVAREEPLDLYMIVSFWFVLTFLITTDRGRNKTIIITISVIIGTLITILFAYLMWRRASKNSDKSTWKKINKAFSQFNKSGTGTPEQNNSDNVFGEGGLSQISLQELLLFDFEKLATATNNFHLSNKLGQGGFGPVYKGKLQDGREIAVKRLSRASGQGIEEFTNEVVVLCKLQHRNLVRLLGCCVDGDEKMLMYEYMPNKNPSKNKLLDWGTRHRIIDGIARGLLYLHKDSRLRIIHRDLKVSNILLDEELNPKISDFGMARIFGGREDHANTNRVVGTYGYMSPEYAMQGHFSEKSDVFSFGVLILEIIIGRRNSSFYGNEHALSLLGFVWIQWREDNILSLIDPEIYDHNHHKNILICIHVGLLCVQESAVDRPTMATVISMLNSEVASLPPPSEPAFILRQNMLNSKSPEENQSACSINNASITDVCGR